MKMDAQFGAKISTIQKSSGVVPHVIIPRAEVEIEKRDDLLSSLPINTGHLLVADPKFTFLIALISMDQKNVIAKNPYIKYVGEVNLDLNALALLVKGGMKVLSNPHITKELL